MKLVVEALDSARMRTHLCGVYPTRMCTHLCGVYSLGFRSWMSCSDGPHRRASSVVYIFAQGPWFVRAGSMVCGLGFGV